MMTARFTMAKRFTVTDEAKRLIILLAIAAAVGSVVGAVTAGLLNQDSFGSLFAGLDAYIGGGLHSSSASGTITENIVKYGKVVLIIWLLGFVPRFGFLSYLVIFAQGAGLGFTTAVLARGFGIDGVLYASALYLPQTLIILPAYFLIAVSTLSAKRNVADGYGTDGPHNKYTFHLPLAMSVVIVISCYEWAVTPALFVFFS
jgi:stage II sporulation protein M